MYDCGCDNCKTDKINLAADKDKDQFKPVLKAAEKAFKYLHEKGGYSPEDIFEQPYQDLTDETYKIFDSAIKDNDIPPEMLTKLQNDAFIFSGLKTHAQLMEASSMLLDQNGKIKGFNSFAYDFNKINKNYNQNYLEAEYQFAVNSSQMAANWASIDPDGRYNLQYRTAADDRVRIQHEALHNTTLPADDPFWMLYYPPNGWRCRCTVVEVLKRKYELSDSKKAIEQGEKATSQIGKDGKNKLEIFRFNPGVQKKVFPPKHPYNKVKGAEEVKETLIEKPLKTTSDLSKYFETFAETNKDFFVRGFKEIKLTEKKNANGFTDMNGMIALKPDISALVIEGVNNIKSKKPTTFEQERAISTLHHELWHNANKPGMVRMNPIQISTMELANEFVSRKTLPQFMEKLGGKLQNEELTQNRNNTGYNRMVNNYDQIIKWSGADPKKVLETVKTHLVNEKYDIQMEGLVKAIKEHSKYDISGKEVEKLIELGKQADYPVEVFKEHLESNKNLLKKKS